MILYGIAIFTRGGTCVAFYPESNGLLEHISPFLAAHRAIARAVEREDIQEITWIERKVIYLHSTDPEISLAIIVNINDDPIIAKKLLSYTRDRFLIGLDVQDLQDGAPCIIERNGRLAIIMQDAIDSAREYDMDDICIADLPSSYHQIS